MGEGGDRIVLFRKGVQILQNRMFHQKTVRYVTIN